MKKAISLILTLLMLSCTFAIPAHAQNIYDGILIAPPKTHDTPDEPIAGDKKEPLEYIFSNYTAAEIAAISDAIAAHAVYAAGFDEFGNIGYWVSLRISEHPELANIEVLNSTAEKITETVQEIFISKGIDPSAINLFHLTGELSMHVLAILVMDMLIEALWSEFDTYYEMFDLVDLNADEERLSPELLIAIGTILKGLFN